MSTLFVDESKNAGYILVAAVVHPSGAESLRKAMRALVLPGQRRLHFSRESDSRRRLILSKLLALEVRAHVIRSTASREADGREECLVGLVDCAEKHAHLKLVLERDESIERSDRRILFRELSARGLRDTVQYELRSPHSEPLLWIPDAIAWSYAKGSEWRRRVGPMLVDPSANGA
ncbi:hypothetical protein [Herbiconiux sp. VKM Ac-2851]|uniref:hypothetical protein n=1 Tax=Herbiconiux sp. VKM Ac-2851 TaxID=2739025 RepID=UPI001566AD37|nr:hypothetical protein [Herbiconiux sp. VKM Ac-2851]NQX36462.1 hypothetical protein [Herbiconiux sp. VKM Ac-2851]